MNYSNEAVSERREATLFQCIGRSLLLKKVSHLKITQWSLLLKTFLVHYTIIIVCALFVLLNEEKRTLTRFFVTLLAIPGTYFLILFAMAFVTRMLFLRDQKLVKLWNMFVFSFVYMFAITCFSMTTSDFFVEVLEEYRRNLTAVAMKWWGSVIGGGIAVVIAIALSMVTLIRNIRGIKY